VDQETHGLITAVILMNQGMYHFSELFAQLGLPSEPVDIVHFLMVHTAMADGFRLADAPYWTPSQASFLRESLLQDSEWSGVVDQLSKALQGPQAPCPVSRG
jgi:hypothetical protein